MSQPSRMEIERYAQDRFRLAAIELSREHSARKTATLKQARLTGNAGAYLPAIIKLAAEKAYNTVVAMAKAYEEAFDVFHVPSDSKAEQDLITFGLQAAGGCISAVRGDIALLEKRTQRMVGNPGHGLNREVDVSMRQAVTEGRLLLTRQRERAKQSGRQIVGAIPQSGNDEPPVTVAPDDLGSNSHAQVRYRTSTWNIRHYESECPLVAPSERQRLRSHWEQYLERIKQVIANPDRPDLHVGGGPEQHLAAGTSSGHEVLNVAGFVEERVHQFAHALQASQGKLGIHADVLRAYTAYLINAVRESTSGAQRGFRWQDDPVTKRAIQVCEKIITSSAMTGDAWPYLEADHEVTEPTWSPVVQEWEAFKASEGILPGLRERLPESVLRAIISRYYGIPVEGVTWTDIRRAAFELCGHYGKVLVVPERTDSRQSERQQQPIASPEFWRERETEFRQHSLENDNLIAVWFSLEGKWSFHSKSNQRLSRERVELFQSLAREAAKGLTNATHPDLWMVWLDALRAATDTSTGNQIYCRNSSTGSWTISERELEGMFVAGDAVPPGGVWEFFIPEGAQTPAPEGTLLAQRRMHWETTSETIDHPFSSSANFCVSLRSQIRPASDEPVRKEEAAVPADRTASVTRPTHSVALRDGSGDAGQTPKALIRIARWAELEIFFTSEERIQITTSQNSITLNYGDLGFADDRTDRPTKAWEALRALAEDGGTIRTDPGQRTRTSRSGRPDETSIETERLAMGKARGVGKSKIAKRMQELRKALRSQFGMADDPIPYITGTGYRASFKIGIRRSYKA